MGFPCGLAGKESACNAGNLGSIPGLGRSPGEGKGYPLQYPGLENSIDCLVHGVAKSWTRLSDFHFTSLHFFNDMYLEPPAFGCSFYPAEVAHPKEWMNLAKEAVARARRKKKFLASTRRVRSCLFPSFITKAREYPVLLNSELCFCRLQANSFNK